MAPGGLIDRTTTLCLACSSSLPPLKSPALSTSSFSAEGLAGDVNALFITQCCQRPICPSCISANPRLARYNPCLVCLGGVSAVASRATSSTYTPDHSSTKGEDPPKSGYNLDGFVRDEDTFILGDDEDEDEDYERSSRGRSPLDTNPPPPYEPPSAGDDSSPTLSYVNPPMQNEFSATPVEHLLTASSSAPSDPAASDLEDRDAPSVPYKYYLNPSDTLTGICLRFGVDSREVCTLNSLPASVLRTTPHLLHTRAFILLPATPKTAQHAHAAAPEVERIRQREVHRVRERAEKRLQTLTKETDYRVAKAYVALADDADARATRGNKQKEVGAAATTARSGTPGPAELEAMAVEQYLDDDEWEAAERKAGRIPKARPLPFVANSSHRDAPESSKDGGGRKGWWSKFN
ncbi:hypothetical protein HYPSUDRAFT_52658 [Hypholoma sublateritium FD-334 SS-4]|uniref:LysM domain-containing protein n=1 Tax=Hypholoma sublateritium (strain FD-334 SS-4) TaxID=945553 RepID=A0A0D2Q443_HYPSF|nr:hypothetical protein HYPSUDRAFT_52658 [Hypholoma sublateritium FD-334 SS-4]